MYRIQNILLLKHMGGRHEHDECVLLISIERCYFLLIVRLLNTFLNITSQEDGAGYLTVCIMTLGRSLILRYSYRIIVMIVS